MKNSLSAAVADGTISEHAAICGLRLDDLVALAVAHANLRLCVRLRGNQGDARLIMTVGEINEWRRLQIPLHRNEIWWSYSDIRDILALASTAS